MPGPFTRTLDNKVARRMALVFFGSTLVPLAGFAWLTISRASSTLQERAQQRLQAEARTLGQEGLGRLDLVARSLDVLVSTYPSHNSPAILRAQIQTVFQVQPDAVTLMPESGPAIPIVGSLTIPPLSQEHAEHLQQWGRLILGDGEHSVLVVRPTTGQGPLVASTLKPAVLFALDDEESLPVDAAACLLSGDRILGCSASAVSDVALAARHGLADEVIPSPSGEQLVRLWTATLGPQYAGPDWTIVLMRPGAIVFAPVATFIRNFILMGLLLAALVTLVSLGLVRRNLRPLEALVAATVRMAQRNFDEPVRVSTHDEFETLASAFNDLSVTLKQQFSDLEAFSLGSLAALARAIDAKSPWTSGHSERVTAVAVAIGTELGLSDEDMDHLKRGGLVHDIGKLATPAEILDKPGRLTAEEQAIMERHPLQGVRILEPIPAFAPLLPIVAEHHERWDGKGYPRGLAGEAIARTARVLSVADVYDALRSDRPYRAGLRHDRVIDIITSGAGSQFDPMAVEAFLTVAPVLEEFDGYASSHAVPDVPLNDLVLVQADRA